MSPGLRRAPRPTAPLAVLLALLVGCARDGGGPGGVRVLRELEVPVRGEARTPRLAARADGVLALAWQEPGPDGGHAVRVAIGRDGGWGEARTVAEGDSFFVNWADFPVVAWFARDHLLATWLVRVSGSPYAYHVMFAVSADEGRTWSEPRRLHADSSATEHGFVSVAERGDHAHVVWLDGHGYAGRAEGDSAARMALHAARVDAEGRVSDERTLDDRVCDCCNTAQAAGLVAYRDRADGEVRDVALRAFAAAAPATPLATTDDRWTIAGCPVNGPAIVPGHVVWYTEGRDTSAAPRVMAARVVPGESPALERVRAIDAGRPLGRIALTELGRDRALAVWLEEDADSARIVARVLGRDADGPVRTLVPTSHQRAGGFPQVAKSGGRLVLAWTDAAAKRVRVAELAVEPGGR